MKVLELEGDMLWAFHGAEKSTQISEKPKIHQTRKKQDITILHREVQHRSDTSK